MDEKTQDSFYLMSGDSVNARGIILHSCTEFETLIDFYISHYFVGNDDGKLQEFFGLIIVPSINFKRKVEIFGVLVNRLHPSFKDKYPKFMTEFSIIVEERNVFAHYPLGTDQDSIDKFNSTQKFQLLRFKNYKLPNTKEDAFLALREFHKTDIQSLLNLIGQYCNAIRDLLNN